MLSGLNCQDQPEAGLEFMFLPDEDEEFGLSGVLRCRTEKLFEVQELIATLVPLVETS